ncbi:MAG: hypothetical protein OHK0044_26300 [Burkholderiaceae bacterium]
MAHPLLILPGLSCVLLAAHLYRAGQLALAAAPLEWLRTLAVFAAQRIAAGLPYARLAAILLAVAAFTAASALVFRHGALSVRYGIGGRL